MNVLHVIETLSPRFGGPVSVVKSLAREQARQGCTVTIATTRSRSDEEYFSPDLGDLVTLREFSTQYLAMRVSIQMARAMPGLVAQCDIVHIHGLYRFPSTIAACTARRLNKPHIIRPFGSLDPFMYSQSSKSVILKRFYHRLVETKNLNQASMIHYTTLDERDRAAHLGLRTGTFVLRNGLDWSRYENLPPRGAFRSMLGLPKDTPVILFLGRINFKKGLDLLVPAFARIKERHPSAVLVIVGPDNEGYGETLRAMIKNHQISDKVHVVDMLAEKSVIQAFVDSDVFVLPSYSENFGMTVIESLACGTPVIISDRVNIHSEIERSGCGSVIRCDVVELTRSIEMLIANPDIRESMGRRGRKWVSANFRWSSVARELLDNYGRIISRNKKLNKL